MSYLKFEELLGHLFFFEILNLMILFQLSDGNSYLLFFFNISGLQILVSWVFVFFSEKMK